MIAWFSVSAILVFQGVAHIRGWPSHPLPLAFAIALSLSLAILTQFAPKAHGPALLIFCFAILIDGVATFANVPRVTQGAIEILFGVLLCLYTFRHRS